tara:strand:+ start:26316 stop:26435 length:120 start_codon:yes stop_codon:yes gene_type:complete
MKALNKAKQHRTSKLVLDLATLGRCWRRYKLKSIVTERE